MKKKYIRCFVDHCGNKVFSTKKRSGEKFIPQNVFYVIMDSNCFLYLNYFLLDCFGRSIHTRLSLQVIRIEVGCKTRHQIEQFRSFIENSFRSRSVMRKTWRIFVVFILIQLHLSSCTQDRLLCPSQCMCATRPAHSPRDEEWIVQLVCEKLHHLPRDLPSNTTRLYIKDSPSFHLTQTNWSKFFQLTSLALENIAAMGTLMPGYFDGLPRLTYLSLNGNNITSIGEGIFSKMSNLRDLSLSSNCIETLLENSFLGLVNLRNLYVSGNPLKSFHPGTFLPLRQLVQLRLMNNKLTYLDQQVFHTLHHLEKLKLNANLLSNLHEKCFRGLHKLRFLDMSRNHLRLLPNNLLSDIRGIQALVLSDNQLEWEVSYSALIGLDQMTHLNLFGNHITSLHKDSFSTLQNLQYLNLRDNKISAIHPEALSHLKNLPELDLSHNHLSEIPAFTFSQLVFLRELYLHHNQISSINGNSFQGLPRLAVLDLHNNSIRSIDRHSFNSLKGSIEVIILAHNQLKTIDVKIFAELKHLVHLNVASNIFNCSCHLISQLISINVARINVNCFIIRNIQRMLAEGPPTLFYDDCDVTDNMTHVGLSECFDCKLHPRNENEHIQCCDFPLSAPDEWVECYRIDIKSDKKDEKLLSLERIADALLVNNDVGTVSVSIEWWEILLGITLFVCVTVLFLVCLRRYVVGQDEFVVRQDEFVVRQDESAVRQDESAVRQDESAVHQVETAI